MAHGRISLLGSGIVKVSWFSHFGLELVITSAYGGVGARSCRRAWTSQSSGRLASYWNCRGRSTGSTIFFELCSVYPWKHSSACQDSDQIAWENRKEWFKSTTADLQRPALAWRLPWWFSAAKSCDACLGAPLSTGWGAELIVFKAYLKRNNDEIASNTDAEQGHQSKFDSIPICDLCFEKSPD